MDMNWIIEIRLYDIYVTKNQKIIIHSLHTNPTLLNFNWNTWIEPLGQLHP